MEKVQECLGSWEAVPGIGAYGSGSGKTLPTVEREGCLGGYVDFYKLIQKGHLADSFVLQRTKGI